MSNVFLIFSIVAATLGPKSIIASDNGFRFSIEPRSIEAGERTTLEIRAPLQEASPYTPHIEDSLLNQASPFLILHSEQKRESHTAVWRYDFTAYQTGDYSIPPIAVHVGPNTYSTERTSVKVTTARTEEDTELRQDFPNLWPKLPWSKILFSAAGLLAAAYACRRLYLLVKRHLKSKARRPPVPVAVQTAIDPLAWLRGELSRLKRELEADSIRDSVVDDLTWILRQYLFLKYKEPFTGRTTSEFKKRILTLSVLSPLVEPFQRLDEFKFFPKNDKDPKALVQEGIFIAEKTLCGS